MARGGSRTGGRAAAVVAAAAPFSPPARPWPTRTGAKADVRAPIAMGLDPPVQQRRVRRRKAHSPWPVERTCRCTSAAEEEAGISAARWASEAAGAAEPTGVGAAAATPAAAAEATWEARPRTTARVRWRAAVKPVARAPAVRPGLSAGWAERATPAGRSPPGPVVAAAEGAGSVVAGEVATMHSAVPGAATAPMGKAPRPRAGWARRLGRRALPSPPQPVPRVAAFSSVATPASSS